MFESLKIGESAPFLAGLPEGCYFEFYRLNHHWWNLPVKSGSYWKMIRRQNEEKSRKESPF